MIGTDAAGYHQHGIGHHPSIGLIGELHGGVQRRIQGKRPEQVPLSAILPLIHRHGRRAPRIVYRIAGVGGADGISRQQRKKSKTEPRTGTKMGNWQELKRAKVNEVLDCIGAGEGI